MTQCSVHFLSYSTTYMVECVLLQQPNEDMVYHIPYEQKDRSKERQRSQSSQKSATKGGAQCQLNNTDGKGCHVAGTAIPVQSAHSDTHPYPH